jgi:CsoR family transcriptional regulator, copper-sensing transcriptional repressor
MTMRTDIKKKATQRLNIIQGQLRGLAKMVEGEKYCVDIITQASAIKEALSGVEDLVLENHLSTHVLQQIKGGKEQKAIAEILKVYKLSHKRK